MGVMPGRGALLVLGPVELHGASGSVPVGGPIARTLLAKLVLARGRSVPDEQCVDAVWEEPPDSVEAALRVHISHVRAAARAVGADVVREFYGYALVGEVDVVDLEEVDRLAAGASGDTSVERQLDAVARALSLWRGPSVVDIRRLPFGAALAAELDDRRSRLEDTSDELLVECGRGREVAAKLERLLADDPLHESRWVLLGKALHQQGRTADALRTLDRARRELAEVAGLLPGAALQELEARLLAGEPATASLPPSTLAAPASLARRLPAVFVGRRGVRAAIHEALDAIDARESSQVIVLRGEAGVGKTALAAAVAVDAAEAGVRVLHAWCDEGDQSAFAPLREVLGTATPEEPASPYEPLEPSEARAAALAAARAALTELAAGGPMLLVLDDLHLGDELTRTLLRRLARTPVPFPLTVLGIERPSHEPMLEGRGVIEVAVPSLDGAEVEEWLEAAGRTESAEDVLAATSGLPLLVEAVLGAGSIPWSTSALGAQMLRDRAAPLRPSARRTLVAAGILGTTFPFAALQCLEARDDLDLLEDLDAAVTAGVLRYDEEVVDRLWFTHALLRDALVEEAAPLRRMALHRAVVERAAAVVGPVGTLLHARASAAMTTLRELVDLTLVAADELTATCAYHEAAIELRATLDACTRASEPTPGGHARLLARLARAEAGLGDAAAHAHLDEAISAAADEGDPVLMAEVLMLRGLFGTRYDTSARELDELSRLFDDLPAGAREQRFAVMRQLGYALLNAGALDAAREHLAQLAALAREIGHPGAIVGALSLEHWFHESAGDRVQRRRCADEALAAGARGTDEDRHRAIAMAIIEALHDGRPDDADGLARELTKVGSSLGRPHTEWLGMAAQFSRPFLAGDTGEAATLAERAVAHGRECGVTGAWGAYATQTYALGWLAGELAGFVEPLESLRVEGPDTAWRGALALALAISGEPKRAADVLLALEPALAGSGVHWLGLLGVMCAVEAAHLVEVRSVLETAEPVLRARMGDHLLLGTGAMDYGPATRYLALALAGTGRAREAADLLEAVAHDTASGRVWAERARLDLGQTAAAEAAIWRTEVRHV